MADDGLATKAPESDAAEQSVFPGDTRAQDGASVGVRQRNQAGMSAADVTRSIALRTDHHVCESSYKAKLTTLTLFVAAGEAPSGVSGHARNCCDEGLALAGDI